MILIFSKDRIDYSTGEVIRWLKYYRKKFIRINSEDISNSLKFNLNLSNEINAGYFISNNNVINFSDIDVVWFRREGDRTWLNLSEISDYTLRNEIEKHIRSEVGSTISALYHFFSNAKWLSHPSTSNINKIVQLCKAKKVGLNIPTTKLTNSTQELNLLLKEKKSVIVKSIYNCLSILINGHNYNSYTAKINAEYIHKLPSLIFPCLAQEYIEKDYEIRIFYLSGEFYSMAIFSQKDKQTEVDFRNYNWDVPNRTVPYKLPDEVKNKIVLFMKEFDIETGSIDMIKSKKGDYVFLEVNPIGQFGMTSYPCNYYLEKKISEQLIEKDRNGNK